MKLTIKGRTTKRVKRSLIAHAARWYGRHLFDKKIYRKMKLTVHFKTMPIDILGECGYKDPKKCNYKYEIELNRDMGERRILTTLAHEMVHARQYASGDYVAYKRESMSHLVKWNDYVYDLNEVDYWDLPWEIDASGRELGLYIRFINHMVEKGKL